MIAAQDICTKILILPQEVGITEVNGTVDTRGYDYAQILLIEDTAAASSVLTQFTLAEGDASNSFTDIEDFTLGDSTHCEAIVAPNMSTGDIVRYDVDLRKRKRYLQIGVASTTARLLTCIAILSRAEVSPVSDAERGATQVVQG